MYARLVFLFSVYLLSPALALAETTLGEASDLPLSGSHIVSDPVFAAGILGVLSLVSSIVTMSIKSKGWPSWLQIVVDGLNALALNIFKNKNADAKEE